MGNRDWRIELHEIVNMEPREKRRACFEYWIDRWVGEVRVVSQIDIRGRHILGAENFMKVMQREQEALEKDISRLVMDAEAGLLRSQDWATTLTTDEVGNSFQAMQKSLSVCGIREHAKEVALKKRNTETGARRMAYVDDKRIETGE